MKLNTRFFVVAAISGILSAQVAAAAELKMLQGHVPREVARLTAIGRLPATNQLNLAVGLPLRDPVGLSNFLADVYNPASPNFRHFLTVEELTARFGPSEQDYDAVKEFARTNGLTVTGTFKNRLVLDLSGPVSAVEKACKVTFHTYQHPTEPRIFFAPDSNPVVSAALPVVDIQGLTDATRPQAKARKLLANILPRGGSAPDQSGAFFGDDFRRAYAAGSTMTGAGQSVGLLAFDGFFADDIKAYAQAAGSSRDRIVVTNVLVDNFTGTPYWTMGVAEVSLDIEMAMAMAPGLSKIVVFEGGPMGRPNDILNSMLAYSTTIKQLSCSWGWPGGPSTTTEAIFQSMAAVGQSFFNASGDSDAFTPGTLSTNGVDNITLANAPSSSPNITQVGGTTLAMNGTGASYGSETVWNWDQEFPGQQYDGQGSSGGYSSIFPLPWWQANIDMAARGGSQDYRNIPDVAMTADNVYVVTGGKKETMNMGGTSCAAPLWAGFMALVNQAATESGGSSVGFINPAIYGLAAGPDYATCFHDVTTGNNTWSVSPNAFYATSGYDLCTGLGTPNGAALINALGADTLALAAGARGFNFTGPFGGPLSPASATFVLTNTGNSVLSWSLANDAAWLVADSLGGTIPAHASANVQVSVTAVASNLLAGTYMTTLVFSNWTTHIVHRAPAALDVQEALLVSPTMGFMGGGPIGGPFKAASQTFVLTNIGGGTVGWNIANTSAWLNVSQATGSLAPGGQATVAVTPATAANSLPPGDYDASLVILDQAVTIAEIPFSLSVGQLVLNRSFETGDFTDWNLSGTTEYTFITNNTGGFVHSGLSGAMLGATPSVGYLFQDLETTPGQAYVLSFALRNPTGGSLHKGGPNMFQAQWNGETIFAETNITSYAWNKLVFNVTAAGPRTTLQFCFEDDPAFLALDDVSVIPLLNPSVTATSAGVAFTGPNNLELKWNTSPGTTYQLQYKTDLTQPDWIDLGAAVMADSSVLTLTDTTTAPSSQRFYRLVAR